MGRLVNGRRSVHGDQNLMPNNIRNVFSVGVAETTITEQKQGSLLDVASNVHGAISKTFGTVPSIIPCSHLELWAGYHDVQFRFNVPFHEQKIFSLIEKME
ncbi:hypothetical protein D5086_006787 [Populus alba]|uniref:Uncharacterized protein n=1 Tax=Populus alba TaxID=43335 RepID=A0ACC4CMU5_POPAL